MGVIFGMECVHPGQNRSVRQKFYNQRTRTIQKTLKQRCFSDLLALQRALQKGCTNAVFRSLQQCIFVTA